MRVSFKGLGIRGIGERKRFRFSKGGGEGRRGRLRGERFSRVLDGSSGGVVGRRDDSGCLCRVLHLPYRRQIGIRLSCGRGSSGDFAGVTDDGGFVVGVSRVMVR